MDKRAQGSTSTAPRQSGVTDLGLDREQGHWGLCRSSEALPGLSLQNARLTPTGRGVRGEGSGLRRP